MSDQDAIHRMEKIKLTRDEYLVVYVKDDADRTYLETLYNSLERIFKKHKGRMLIVRGQHIRMDKKNLEEILTEITEKSLLTSEDDS